MTQEGAQGLRTGPDCGYDNHVGQGHVPAEKIYSEESANRSVIILRPEGMFYRAYERSAYLVCKSIKEFKPTKRFYKNIGQEIVSIGFPKETYPKYIGERTSVVDSDGTVRVRSGMELDEGLFGSWKQSLPLASAKESRHSFEGDRIQVYRESYALLMKVFESLVNVSRDFKQIPGEDIRRDSLNLVRSVLKANDASPTTLFCGRYSDDSPFLFRRSFRDVSFFRK